MNPEAVEVIALKLKNINTKTSEALTITESFKSKLNDLEEETAKALIY